MPWSALDAMRRLLMVPCALGLAAGAIGFAPAPAWQTARKWQATRTCRPALGRVALARPLGGQAVRTSRKPGHPLVELRAESSDDDRDEWENYAMLHDVEVEGDENSEDSPVGADLMYGDDLAAQGGALHRNRAPLLEADPRAVHTAADTALDDTALLQGTAFGQMGLSVELCRSLADMNIHTPTPIQRESLPVSLAGESVLLCAETGSGKSLAFLLPLVSRLKNDEIALGIHARPKRPRAIVLAPTRELAAQLLGVAKGLSRHAKFSSVGALGGSSMAAQAKRLKQPVDLLVATPGRLVDLVKEGHVSLGDVRFVVADEADTMAAQGFGPDLEKLLSSIVAASDAAKETHRKALELEAQQLAQADSALQKDAIEAQLKVVRGPFQPNDRGHVQCVLAAATVAQSVTAIIQSTFPKTRQIKTALAHRVPDGLFQEFVSVTSGDRALRLLEVLDRGRRMNLQRFAQQGAAQGASRDATIVFCNTKDSALFAAKLLRENDYDVSEGHGWVAQHERLVQMEDFMSGKKKILVATDVVARGIDTINVAHVINFDFPLNPIDYIHRIGRTGRGGGKGRVTNLVTKADYTLAMAIERATKLGEPIEGLSSRKSDYVQGRPGLLKSAAQARAAASAGSVKTRSKPGSQRRSAPAPKLGKGGVALPQAPAKKRKPKDTTMKSMRRAGSKKKR